MMMDPGNLWNTQVIRTSIILDPHGRGATMQTLLLQTNFGWTKIFIVPYNRGAI